MQAIKNVSKESKIGCTATYCKRSKIGSLGMRPGLKYTFLSDAIEELSGYTVCIYNHSDCSIPDIIATYRACVRGTVKAGEACHAFYQAICIYVKSSHVQPVDY